MPTLATEPSDVSENFTRAIEDHNQALRDVAAEKADIDRRQTQLELAIANLMQALPAETREQLLSATGAGAGGDAQMLGGGAGGGGGGAGGVQGDGGAGMQWPTTEFGGQGMADADLEKLLAQYGSSFFWVSF